MKKLFYFLAVALLVPGLALASVSLGDLGRLTGVTVQDWTFSDVTITDDLAVTDAISAADVAATDDLTVGDDAAITDSLSAEDAVITRVPAADSAATNNGVSIAITTPVDTTGTNGHNGLIISPTIGNASGGTNTFDALEIGAITGDAQVTEVGIKIGTGYDSAMTIGAASGLPPLQQTGFSKAAMYIAVDTDLDNGQTSEAVTVTGITSAALCFATITNDSTTEVSVTNVVASANTATVQVSGDPGASGADLAVVCYE